MYKRQKGRVREIGKIKSVRIIERSRTRAKGKDKASSENKDKWRKPSSHGQGRVPEVDEPHWDKWGTSTRYHLLFYLKFLVL